MSTPEHDQATAALESVFPDAQVWSTIGVYNVDLGPGRSDVHVQVLHNPRAGYRVEASNVDNPGTANGWHESDLRLAILHTHWKDLES